MSTVQTSRLLRCTPYFAVADVEKSMAHYQTVLGFRCEYVGGSPPEFAILSRDGLGLMLRRVADPREIKPIEKQGGTWDAFFWVSDVDALFQEMRSNAAEIVYGPLVQDYGMKEFAVRDGDGHVLGFGQEWRR